MIKIKQTKLVLNFLLLFVLSMCFFACEQSESFTTSEEENATSLFTQHLTDNTQTINAKDLGEGQYEVTGEQGTRVVINNALVNAKGERVRGDIDVVLIEIYSQADMILNRKQTLADYDGQNVILESGGEVFVKVYQNGEELSVDGKGNMDLFLPTENTGGAKEDMELYYGIEDGEQVIWKPTGKAVKVINSALREGGEYWVAIENILGWHNVDKIYEAGGEEVECVEVKIECEEFCEEPGTEKVTVAIHVSSVGSAFELTYDPGSGAYRLCGDGQALPLGGIQVTFIVVVECPEGGPAHVALVTTTVSQGYHVETVTCDNFQQMDPGQFEDALKQL